MSKLLRRLQRLENTGTIRVPAPNPPVPNPSDPPCDDDRAATLEKLRQTIARIVARRTPSPDPPSPAFNSITQDTNELPFDSKSTPFGLLHLRNMPFDLQHRVGRFPVHTARRADSLMLSLLALDPKLANVDMSRALYLDTETTGLSGGTGTLPFLIGLGYFIDDGPFLVEQLLLRRPGEEAPILMHVLDRLRDASALVTFNGKAFDIPLVRTRFVMNRMPPMPELPHLDLVHLARRIHKPRIGACNLGSVESQVLGFGRVDDVPSGEVASRYFHYLRTGDEDALMGVVTHNVWDIVSMAALVGLYGEPLDGMDPTDLAGVASTVHRAKQSERASELAEAAVARGGGVQAKKVRALLSKARGERDAALADFEALVHEVDDPGLRLELAKLYEHHAKLFQPAMDLVDLGIAERNDATLRRKSRLEGKLKRQQAKSGSLAKQTLLPIVSQPPTNRTP